MQKAALSPIAQDFVTVTKRRQPAEIAVELWDLIFYHANADAKDPFHLAMHAKHRLISRKIGAAAERKFFEEIYLPGERRRRMIQCLRLMAAKPHLAGLVRDVHIELNFDLNLFSVIWDVTSGLQAMCKLRILHLRTTCSWEDRGALHTILRQIKLPWLEEFEYYGAITQEIQSFIAKHSSNIRLLTLCGEEVGEFLGPEPSYPALLHASVPRRMLYRIFRGGAPLLRSFHAPPETSSDNVMAMVQQLQTTCGAAMVELSLIAHDDGQGLFPVVEELFPNLVWLTILLSGDRAVAFGEPELSDQAAGEAALACCRRLTRLNKLVWGHVDGYHGDWDQGWNFLESLQKANPGIVSVTLPDSGVWRAVGPGTWVPICGGGGLIPCNQGCYWLTFSIYYGAYPSLLPLLALIEQEIIRWSADVSTSRDEGMRLVQSFRAHPGDRPLEEVSGLVTTMSQLGFFAT
ncbi:hypothetical protein VNI00_018939 [Paramarasmius palmivorus]|uniref:Uncharacterized protein n=1 Tax=Paramarasmius palmivorus TaxID=297713 RepID=A0AAW0AVS8_9AGAR